MSILLSALFQCLPTLPVGVIARPFGLINQQSETVYLQKFQEVGQSVLIHFYWSPLDQASQSGLLALKAAYPTCAEKQVEIVAISPFDWEIQHRLAAELALPYSMLYDPLSKASKAYKARVVPTFFNRPITYLVNAEGQIQAHLKGFPLADNVLALLP